MRKGCQGKGRPLCKRIQILESDLTEGSWENKYIKIFPYLHDLPIS
jgi:hypothetical protein